MDVDTRATTRDWVIRAMWVLAAGGLLHVLAYAVPVDVGASMGRDPDRMVAVLTSTPWLISMLLPVFGLAAVTLGAVALTVHLSQARASSRAPVTALILNVVGVTLYLPFRGVLAYALPAAGRAFAQGQPDAIELAGAISAAAFNPITVLGHVLYWAAWVTLGVLVWRTGSRPTGIALALHSPLMHGPLFAVRPGGVPVFALLGAALLSTAGVLLARGVRGAGRSALEKAHT